MEENVIIKSSICSRLICLALAIVMLFSLVACSKAKDNNASNSINTVNNNNSSENSNNSEGNNSSADNNCTANSINEKANDPEYTFARYIDTNPVKDTTYIDNAERTLYQINCNIDNDKKILNCNETISFINATGVDLSNMSLHLYPDFYAKDGVYIDEVKKYVVDEKYADITINKVVISDKDIQFTQDKEILKFELPAKLPNNERLDIYIEFEVKMPCTTMRLTCTDDDYSVTYWYPIVCMYNNETNTWDERAYHPNGESNFSYYNDYDVNVTAPKDFVVVGTGVETEVSSDDTTKEYNLKQENVKDFVFFASQDYKAVSNEIDGIQINSYYKSNEIYAKRMLNDIVGAMEYMNKAVGKYPFKEFDIVESNIIGFAMEYPTIIQMGEYNRNYSEAITEENLIWNDSTVVHEMVHQWFFNIIGNDCYSEPILDETMTEMWTGTYFTYKYGVINPLNALNCVYTTNFSPELLPINRQVDEFEYESDYYTSIYNLGWRIFEDIKAQIGDEKFVEVFRSYYNNNRFTNATVEDLLKEFENVCGKDTRDYVDKAINTKDYDVKKLFLFTNDSIKTLENGFEENDVKGFNMSFIEADENTKNEISKSFEALANAVNSDSKDTYNYFTGNANGKRVLEYFDNLKSKENVTYNIYDIYTDTNKQFIFLYTEIIYDNNKDYITLMYNDKLKIGGFFY